MKSLYSLPKSDDIDEDEMGAVCSKHGTDKKFIHYISSKKVRKD
jgi:hypothetical protein